MLSKSLTYLINNSDNISVCNVLTLLTHRLLETNTIPTNCKVPTYLLTRRRDIICYFSEIKST